MSEIKEFEKEFYDEEYELLILVKEDCGGGVVRGNKLISSVDFFASIDLRTGILSNEKGRVQWVIDNDENREGWGYDFKQFQIYHISVRKCIPMELQPNQMELLNNRYLLINIIDDDKTDEKLEELKEFYQKPVSIENEYGKFILDREYSWYEGSIYCNGSKVTVFLETDDDDDTVNVSLQNFMNIVKDINGNDSKYREFAAKKLTDTANEWLEESDEDDLEEITEEDFAKRMKLSEILFCGDGCISLSYNDDDMFWGHIIEIFVDEEGNITRANIAG